MSATQRIAYLEGMIQELVDLHMQADDAGYRTLTIDEIGEDDEGKPTVLFGTMDTWHSIYSDGKPIKGDDLFRRGQASPVVIGEHEGYEGDPYTNIDRGIELAERLSDLAMLRATMIGIFRRRELDGGKAGAFDHPLMALIEAEKAALEEALIILV